MRLVILVLTLLASKLSCADYGVPFIFQQCNKTLDFVTYKFEYVNNPDQLFEKRKLKDSMKSELIAAGVIFPEYINSTECQLDGAIIKVWLDESKYLSLSINDVKKVEHIPIDGGAIFFDKITIDGSNFPKGAQRGGIILCYFGPDKERSVTREFFRVYSQYPNTEIINIDYLYKEVNLRNNMENPSYIRGCSGFDRYLQVSL